MALGVACLVLHDQLISNWRLPGADAFIIATAVAQILGGAAMLFDATAAIGAVILGAVYLVASLTFTPDVTARPAVYANIGNVFYQLALVVGAAVTTLRRAAVILFGLCNISFAIEQVEFLPRTVSLVPAWIPPNGMFWAVATTIAFALAGVALVINYRSLLASRLLAVMLLLFGVTIWIPILFADPASHSNWSEGLETFAIAGVAWVVADYLQGEKRREASSCR